jgi:hypothetical protein
MNTSTCENCKKVFSNKSNRIAHQKSSKSCIRDNANPPVFFPCTICNKTFTANSRLLYHSDKFHPNFTTPTPPDVNHSTTNNNTHTINNNGTTMNNNNTQIINNNGTTNTNTMNNNITINIHANGHITELTKEEVCKIFEQHFSIETLLGGPKQFADFVIDQFIANNKIVYLCVDRSRKKCMITTDFKNFTEDRNNEVLLRILSPGFITIRDKVEWSSFERKYESCAHQIHQSFDEILAIQKEGTIFKSQLCKRLPSSLDEWENMKHDQPISFFFDQLRENEKKNYLERTSNETAPDTFVPMPTVPNSIANVTLGKLDVYRTLYRDKGIYKIYGPLQEIIDSNPDISAQYEEYVKHDRYKGTKIH